MKQLKFLIIIFLLLLNFIPTVQAQWLGNVGVTYNFNDNLSNAQLPVDIKSDSAFRYHASAGNYFQLTDFTGLSVTADIGGTTQFHYHGLNNIFYGAGFNLKHKFGLGGYTPWLSLSGAAAYHDFEHDPRDGIRYNLSFAVGKRLSERFDLELRYRYEERISDRVVNIPFLTTLKPPIYGDAYDLTAHNISLTGLFTITDSLTAYLSYTRRQGGVISTTLRNLPIFLASDAIATDEAFGNNRFAYRIDAGTNIYSIGLSWALNNHASLNVGYDYQDSSASHGLDYSNNLAHFSVLYDF